MGKAAYKHFKKAEKAKVKLKGKQKLLPKGLNVTETNFKVKKIIIKEQLSKHGESEILAKKHLNLQDLISRLKHHNVRMKLEALAGLQELIRKFNNKVIGTNLAALLDAVMYLSLDKEGDVRTNTLKLLSLILKEVTEEQISPLFSTISSYVACAMTHIDPRIREDSLTTLDTLIDSLPHLTALVAPNLLLHFLDLISDNRNSGRTLSLHLDGKMSSEKWRFCVFVKLKKLLILVSDVNKEDKKTAIREVCWNPNQSMYLSIYKTVKETSLMVQEGEMSLGNQIKDCTTQLVPLLMDAVTEVLPQDVGVIDGDHEIPLAAALFLHCIVDIINLLWELLIKLDTENEFKYWFQSTYGSMLSAKLLNNHFPYVAQEISKKATKDMLSIFKLDIVDKNCLMLNLELSYICLQLTDLDENVDKWKNCFAYLEGCLSTSDELDDKQCSVLKKCLEVACNSCDTYNEECAELFDLAAEILLNYKTFNTPHTKMLFNFLSEVACDSSKSHLHEANHFTLWLENLPILLTQPNISQMLVNTTVQLASRNLTIFSSTLDVWIEQIIDNLPSSKIDGKNNLVAKKSLINLLYWVKDWDEEMVNSLSRAIEHQYLGPELTSYLVDILYLKYQNGFDDNIHFKTLLSNMPCWRDISRV